MDSPDLLAERCGLVVKGFFRKALLIVLQSKTGAPCNETHDGSQVGRVDRWFNLDLPVPRDAAALPTVKPTVALTARTLHVEPQTVQLEIFLDLSAVPGQTFFLASVDHEGAFKRVPRHGRILLERWIFSFTSDTRSPLAEVYTSLPQLYKHLIVDMRALFTYCAWLPSAGSSPWLSNVRHRLRYSIVRGNTAGPELAAVSVAGAATRSIDLNPAKAPFGHFSIKVDYRHLDWYVVEDYDRLVQALVDPGYPIPMRQVDWRSQWPERGRRPMALSQGLKRNSASDMVALQVRRSKSLERTDYWVVEPFDEKPSEVPTSPAFISPTKTNPSIPLSWPTLAEAGFPKTYKHRFPRGVSDPRSYDSSAMAQASKIVTDTERMAMLDRGVSPPSPRSRLADMERSNNGRSQNGDPRRLERARSASAAIPTRRTVSEHDDLTYIDTDARRRDSMITAPVSRLSVSKSPDRERSLYGDPRSTRRADRSPSVVSGRNSSMRGDNRFETDYQRSRPRRGSGSSAGSYHIERDVDQFPGLPTEKTTAEEYHCEFCNKSVTIRRNRDWQRHVIRDIEPYMCLETKCKVADKPFASIRSLHKHYIKCHPKASILDSSEPLSCYFCEDLLPNNSEKRLVHLARHMEEVAFSVIPQVRQQWVFYSEDSDDEMSSSTEYYENLSTFLKMIESHTGLIKWGSCSEDLGAIIQRYKDAHDEFERFSRQSSDGVQQGIGISRRRQSQHLAPVR